MRHIVLVHPSRDRTIAYLLRLLLAMLLSARAAAGVAGEQSRDPFRGDARLRKTVTVRVSRMPIGELLPRLATVLGVRLGAEGEDVADQKVDLFTHGPALSGAELLTAITDLLNAACPPRGYRWDRLGRAPNFRYALVRDVASRQWEARRATEAEERMPRVLRERFAALGRTPFRAESAGSLELPSMRRLLPLLTDEQFARLCRDRTLSLKPEECTPAQKTLLRQLVRELMEDWGRRSPQQIEEALARSGPLETFQGGGMGVLVRGEAPRYTIEVSADGPHPIGQLGYIGEAVDAAAPAAGAVATEPLAALAPPGVPDSSFALPRGRRG